MIRFQKTLSSFSCSVEKAGNPTEIGKIMLFLDNVKGSGHYVGTYLGLSALQRYWWGEGEVKFYIDGDENIQQYVEQGMEDYFWRFLSFASNEKWQNCRTELFYPIFGISILFQT